MADEVSSVDSHCYNFVGLWRMSELDFTFSRRVRDSKHK